jgi:tRNA-modifying protein YgfZ
MVTIRRRSRALFRFSGVDAQKLLFDVLTPRVAAEPGPDVWWALLSPQGKVQAEGRLTFEEDAFWIDVDESAADAFLRRMRMLKLRAAVDIYDLRQTHQAGWTDAPGGSLPGKRVIGPEDAGWVDDDGPYRVARIAAGIAELGPDFAPDSVFPHDIGMDLLGGIDFKKGCYIGQEVVSRMQHRGTARRRPVIVSGIPAGTNDGTLLAGGREAGTIGAIHDGSAVGIVRLDRIGDPSSVTVGGQPVALALPSWATYRFGESGAEE